MNEKRATLEVIAPTIEEAVEKGLKDLGLPQDQVEVEILDEGSKGLFGLGSRQARIRLVVKTAQAPTEPPEPSESMPARAARPPRKASAPKEPPAPQPVAYEAEEDEEEEEFEDEGEKDLALQVTHDTLEELLEKMHINASISTRFAEPEANRSRLTVRADITGKDLSVLIGRQAETLNALQYIASLIVSKELGRLISLSVDVQGYRQRREQQIRQLARRMAEQAVKTGRRQVLEPMPANERRLVHLELRENPDVKTESIGEDPRRKVTIVPR